MSRWPGKYVIGLTGNISTGKSLVRKMLEHLGAFGIDADGLAGLAMSPGGPAYLPVVDTFGQWIVASTGEIDRSKLANIVFSDPDALAQLEAIVHPIVVNAINTLIQRASQQVIAIEAIKLLESGLADDCDAIWVVDATEELQLKRLTEKRGWSEQVARQRMDAQPPQSEKLERATVVITNTGSFREPWAQVQKEWEAITGVPAPEKAEEPEVKPERETAPVPAAEAEPIEISLDRLAIERGKPSDAQNIADFINRNRTDGDQVTADNLGL